MAADRLSLPALNRATLDRQLLARRHAMTAQQAVAHLAGLQAQAPLAPYVGLWTRLAGLAHEELKTILTERSVLRAHLTRNTVHLVTAADFRTFRPLFQPVIERALAGAPARRQRGHHGCAAGRRVLAGRKISRGKVRAGLEIRVHPAAVPRQGRHRRRGPPPARVRGASRRARRQVRTRAVKRE